MGPLDNPPVSGDAGPVSAPYAHFGPCPSEFPGFDFSLAVGAPTCPSPETIAFWVYGQTILPECEKVTGPLSSSPVGSGWRCEYQDDSTGCGYGVSTWTLEPPYFGPGGPRLTLPTATVDLDALCAVEPAGYAAAGDAGAQASATYGVWFSCNGEEANLGPGVAFFEDGTFQNLGLDDEGHIYAEEGCDAFGLWGYLPSYPIQMNIHVAEGTASMLPTFSDDRQHFQAQTFGGDAHYVRIPTD